MTEREALIALNCIPGIGAMTVRRAIERLGSAAAAFACSEEALLSVPGVGPERARLICSDDGTSAARELGIAKSCGARLVTWDDPEYPALLKTIADPPLVLYVAGSLAGASAPAVAIVGTRHASIYGRQVARQFAAGLAAAGYTVVSGLAEGIDTEAHRGALEAKGKTFAVLGGALDKLYPKSNAPLARSIVTSGGAVLTEYPFGRQPDAQTFPMRNRIVSGLCRGVLAVEAPLKSGTLITVSQALEQGRTVMAVPGPVNSPSSQGTNRLLRNGAKLVTSVDDVIEELQDLFAATRQAAAEKKRDAEILAPRPILSEEERSVMQHLDVESVTTDTLVRETDLQPGRLSALLVGMQLKRLVRLLPGGFVQRFEGKKNG